MNEPTTPKHKLTIASDSGEEIVAVQLGEINPLTAAHTVIAALAGIRPPRKDKRVSRGSKTPTQQ